MTTIDSSEQSRREATVPERGVSIAEAARRTGLTVYTLRYYERSGMMPIPPGRTSGGSRRYHAAELEWIRVCTKLRATGMSTERIRRYVELVREGPGNERQRLELFEAHRVEVLARLASVTENLELIDNKIAAYRRWIADGSTDARWWTPR